jgi:hypothetical protein
MNFVYMLALAVAMSAIGCSRDDTSKSESKQVENQEQRLPDPRPETAKDAPSLFQDFYSSTNCRKPLNGIAIVNESNDIVQHRSEVDLSMTFNKSYLLEIRTLTSYYFNGRVEEAYSYDSFEGALEEQEGHINLTGGDGIVATVSRGEEVEGHLQPLVIEMKDQSHRLRGFPRTIEVLGNVYSCQRENSDPQD